MAVQVLMRAHAAEASGPATGWPDIVIAIGPPLLMVLLILIILWWFRRQFEKLLSDATKFVVTLPHGVKVAIERTLEAAITKQKVSVSTEDRFQAISRLERNRDVFEGARILWVDDNPEGNNEERGILTRLGAQVDLARTSETGESELRRAKGKNHPYHAVITDMEREGDKEAGRKFAEKISKEQLFGRTIVYMGQPFAGDLPPYLHGATNRPNDLLHLVADVLERERQPSQVSP